MSFGKIAGQRILITGGAGFIGSHVADELLKHGYDVRALDNLTPQVHGALGSEWQHEFCKKRRSKDS